MRDISPEDIEHYFDAIKNGAVFIYPTDTIYGLGCNAQITESVEKIRKIKNRDKKPFSVIAPSKEWIIENCSVSDKWLQKLPGPYTLIVRLKNKQCISKNVNNGLDTLGVRIPDHWFSNIIERLEIPFVTTSVNISGNKPMASIEDIDDEVKEQVDFLIYEGEKTRKPSTIIDAETGKIVKR